MKGGSAVRDGSATQTCEARKFRTLVVQDASAAVESVDGLGEGHELIDEVAIPVVSCRGETEALWGEVIFVGTPPGRICSHTGSDLAEGLSVETLRGPSPGSRRCTNNVWVG